jgi:hypothetical protein
MKRLLRIAGLALAALLAGVPSARAQAPVRGDPCTFFSKKELESALGFPLGPGKPGTRSSTCEYASAAQGTITIRANSAVIPQDFAISKKVEGPKGDVGTRIGDDAFFSTKGIWARKGSRMLIIQLGGKGLTPTLRTALVSLGKLGAARLR